MKNAVIGNQNQKEKFVQSQIIPKYVYCYHDEWFIVLSKHWVGVIRKSLHRFLLGLIVRKPFWDLRKFVVRFLKFFFSLTVTYLDFCEFIF